MVCVKMFAFTRTKTRSVIFTNTAVKKYDSCTIHIKKRRADEHCTMEVEISFKLANVIRQTNQSVKRKQKYQYFSLLGRERFEAPSLLLVMISVCPHLA